MATYPHPFPPSLPKTGCSAHTAPRRCPLGGRWEGEIPQISSTANLLVHLPDGVDHDLWLFQLNVVSSIIQDDQLTPRR